MADAPDPNAAEREQQLLDERRLATVVMARQVLNAFDGVFPGSQYEWLRHQETGERLLRVGDDAWEAQVSQSHYEWTGIARIETGETRESFGEKLRALQRECVDGILTARIKRRLALHGDIL